MPAPVVVNGAHFLDDQDALVDLERTTINMDRLETFLDELDGAEDARWMLTKDHEVREYPDPVFSCQLVQSFLSEGYFVYRLRPFKGLGKYRILYVYDGTNEKIRLLAVVRKRPSDPEFAEDDTYYNYERNHPISVRVRAEYDDLGLPKRH